ncbi:DUF6238 family protein [Actinacidiphila sp. bgisy144]|uniref:DUF6238 family protein n=1 Tax=Actinacidiphila sp. bgisy144 TaxID=3413791 RepID=UPI003EBC51EE
MTPDAPDAHPYLRAATAGLRHHARSLSAHDAASASADRAHLDALHAHVIALHQLVDTVATTIRTPHPAAARQVTAAHTRLWQSAAAVHDAFHLLPGPTDQPTSCRPERVPEGPPFLTICQRHLAAVHRVRRSTTPSDLTDPPPGHATICAR